MKKILLVNYLYHRITNAKDIGRCKSTRILNYVFSVSCALINFSVASKVVGYITSLQIVPCLMLIFNGLTCFSMGEVLYHFQGKIGKLLMQPCSSGRNSSSFYPFSLLFFQLFFSLVIETW